jgi:hypothetical protein
VPTIGNKIGECLPQKLGFPSQMYSLFALLFTEQSSAPSDLIWILISALDREMMDIVILFLNGKYKTIYCKTRMVISFLKHICFDLV